MFENQYIKIIKNFDTFSKPKIMGYDNFVKNLFIHFQNKTEFFTKSYSNSPENIKSNFSGLLNQYRNIFTIYNELIKNIDFLKNDWNKYNKLLNSSQFYIKARQGYLDLSLVSTYTKEMLKKEFNNISFFNDKVNEFGNSVKKFEETIKNFFERLEDYQKYLEQRGMKYQVLSTTKSVSAIYGEYKNYFKYAIIIAGIGVVGFYTLPILKPFLSVMEHKMKKKMETNNG